MPRNAFVARLMGTGHAAGRLGRLPWLALPVIVVTVSAIASGCASAAVTSAAVATASNPCAKVGVTSAVAAKIFGSGSKIYVAEATAPAPNYCEITPPGISQDACGAFNGECLEVFALSTSLTSDVAYTVNQLKAYGSGHVSEVSVAGAGSDAVLVLDTNYGNPSYALGPVLYLPAVLGGSDTVSIQGVLGGRLARKEWEALARTIHAHLG